MRAREGVALEADAVGVGGGMVLRVEILCWLSPRVDLVARQPWAWSRRSTIVLVGLDGALEAISEPSTATPRMPSTGGETRRTAGNGS